MSRRLSLTDTCELRSTYSKESIDRSSFVVPPIMAHNHRSVLDLLLFHSSTPACFLLQLLLHLLLSLLSLLSRQSMAVIPHCASATIYRSFPNTQCSSSPISRTHAHAIIHQNAPPVFPMSSPLFSPTAPSAFSAPLTPAPTHLLSDHMLCILLGSSTVRIVSHATPLPWYVRLSNPQCTPVLRLPLPCSPCWPPD